MSSKHLWKIVSASVNGASHEKSGQPCQDFHSWKVIDGEILIVGVADGAGSALFGDEGSKLAVQTAIKRLSDLIDKSKFSDDSYLHNILIDALKSAKTTIEDKAQSENKAIRDFATTLILLIATDELVSAIQIGDGAVIVKEDDIIATLTKPRYREYINETEFLTSVTDFDDLKIEIKRCPIKDLAIMSDGLQMIALNLPEYTPFEGFFLPMFDFLEKAKDEEKANKKLEEFLRSPRVIERTDDDLTLFLATIT